jgi:hypothetical protein
MQWVPTSSLYVGQLASPLDFAAIEQSLATLDQYRGGELRGPFGRPGWLQIATEWVESQALSVGLHLTGSFRQLNASPTFSLVRFETDGPAIWFKAVGEPNVHEYRVTLRLASTFPKFLPNILAARSEWNAWLSVEAEGIHLTADAPLHAWQRAASAFAQLQCATFGNALHLIHNGCKDMRIPTLGSFLAPFFEFATELMDQQTKPSPAPLSRPALDLLVRELGDSLDSLAARNIPNVLGHMDLNPANILVGPTRSVFLDWAEGAVGNPFLSLEYLREHWRRLHGADPAAENDLVSTYIEQWRPLVSPEAMAAALEHTPLVAAFASAVNGMPWQNPEPSRRAAIAPYLRSLTRRMKREADALHGRRVLCVL